MLSRIETDPDELDAQLRITLNERTLVSLPQKISFQSHLRARTLGFIQGLVITEPGSLRVGLYWDDIEHAFWTIAVNQVGQLSYQVVQPSATASTEGG